MNAIVPLIDGLNAAEIWIKLSIKPVIIEYDEEDWGFDPIAALDERNYLMDIMPLKIVLNIFNSLTIKKSIPFILSIEFNHHYFNILQSTFNDRLRKESRMDGLI